MKVRLFWALVLILAIAAAIFLTTVEVPAAQTPEACTLVPLAVVVNLDNETHAQTIAHARAAVAGGQPRILHIERAGAAARRREALRGIPTLLGKDRDEYPPAASAEGGRGADVWLIDQRDNRSSGSKMGSSLAPFCDGQAFIIEP